MKNRERIKDGQPDLWRGKARHDKMVGLVETMMTADGQRLTAYGPQSAATRQVIPDALRPFDTPDREFYNSAVLEMD